MITQNFRNENTDEFVNIKEFLEFYKEYFSEDTYKIMEILLSLSYIGFSNYEVYFEKDSDIPKFWILVYDENHEAIHEYIFITDISHSTRVYTKSKILCCKKDMSNVEKLFKFYKNILKEYE